MSIRKSLTVEITTGAVRVLTLMTVDAEGVKVTLMSVSNITVSNRVKRAYCSSRKSRRYNTRLRSDGGLITR